MTALPPIENRNVRGVLTSKYPPNKTCSHPECDKTVDSVHHIFPRSLIGNGSYFVEIGEPGESWNGPENPPICNRGNVIPHAVGLCGSGTTGHHGDVEEHRAWIRYEDGEFLWFDRHEEFSPTEDVSSTDWRLVGPLNPQPGSREAKAKRRKKQGDERRKRKTISIRVPDDAEDGAAVYDETLALVKERLVAMELYSEGDKIAAYEATIAAWTDWLNG